MRRRIPWWAVVLAFAVVTGTGIGGLAYLRARDKRPRPMYCLQRAPSAALLRERAGHPLVEHGSVRGPNACDLQFRPRAADDAPIELRVVSRRAASATDRMAELQSRTHVHPVAFDVPHVRGFSLLLDDGTYVLFMPGVDGEQIEITIDAKVLPSQLAFDVAEQIGARLR